jgi:hypothetical protein
MLGIGSKKPGKSSTQKKAAGNVRNVSVLRAGRCCGCGKTLRSSKSNVCNQRCARSAAHLWDSVR